jgi:hypothetical protein
MDEVRIDIQDVDYEWFRDVKAFLDRDSDLYYFPRESAERLGEIEEETGDFYFIDGQIEAKADEIEIDGSRIPVWAVGCGRLTVRPAAEGPA